LLLRAGKIRSRLSRLHQSHRVKPEYVYAYYGRGNCYYEREKYDLAIADYTKAIELDPKDDVAYFNRGDCYDKQGEYGKAEADFAKAEELKS
jgi:tetratricopeptide (TPR) repeat protein